MSCLVFSDLFHPRVPGAFHLLGTIEDSSNYVIGRLNGMHYHLWPASEGELQEISKAFGVFDVALGSYEKLSQRDLDQVGASAPLEGPAAFRIPGRIRPLDEPIQEGFHRAAFGIHTERRRLCLYQQEIGAQIGDTLVIGWQVQRGLSLQGVPSNVRFARREYKPA